MLLEGYLHSISTNASARLRSSAMVLQGSTLLLYLKAASLWFHTELGIQVTVICPTTNKILPPFWDTITQSLKWGTPLPKCEPYMHQMLETFCVQARALIKQDPLQHCLRFLAIFDWICLGLFTGSRGNKYCQTGSRRNHVSRVPQDGVAGSHGGEPLAFMMSDFRFLTATATIVSVLEALAKPHSVVELQICFRFDKSPINGRWRKFSQTEHKYLCPVLAGLSIAQRTLKLCVPRLDPLGVYRLNNQAPHEFAYTYLHSREVITVMRNLVIAAHPDPSHYLCQPDCICCIDSHSTQVMACVALCKGNVPVDIIAHKLWWNVESVKHYMRDCSRTVGASTAKVIQGFHNI